MVKNLFAFFVLFRGYLKSVKSVVKYLLFTLLIFTLFFPTITLASGSYSGGNGQPATPFQIAEPNDLIEMSQHSEDWSEHFILTADINLNLAVPNTFTTALISPDTSTSSGYQGTPFTGTFDGQNHTISNLTINTAGAENDYLGLFGRLDSGAIIQNLSLENAKITAIENYSYHLGGLVGSNGDVNEDVPGGNISKCYANASVIGGYHSMYLGSLVGRNYQGTITNCYATGSVNGDSYLGGLVGLSSGNIINCSANGNVTGSYGADYVGGLTGRNSGTISDCHATGNVTGDDYLGGLVGRNSYGNISNCYATGSVIGGSITSYLGGLVGYNNEGIISNCYSTGSVAGGSALGGLVGYNNEGTISNCYTTGFVTGRGTLGGLVGYNNEGIISNCYFHALSGPDNYLGTALGHLQLQNAASFVGFDFVNDWAIVTGHCPKLIWQTDDGPLPPTPPVTSLSGSGCSSDPFQINSYPDFTEFRTNSNLIYGYYTLTFDIDLSSDTFTSAVIDRYFGGHFEGNNHIIHNLIIDTAGAENDYLGLFGRLDSCATIQNLVLENTQITGGTSSDYLGSLVGYNGGTISNCSATGNVTGDNRLGGLVGGNGGTISNCYATGSVTGDNVLGGLVGSNGGTISNCSATGNVTGGDDSEYLGGLVGRNSNLISNCYATGNVNGSSELGGLIGSSGCPTYNDDCTISNSYATGSVSGGTGSYHLGGLVGENYDDISNCYASGNVTGDNSIGGLVGSNGYAWNSIHGNISNSYAIGSVTGVTGADYLGGLVGYNSYGTISSSYFLDTAGPDNGLGTPLTDAQMQIQSNFVGWDFVYETDNGYEDLWRMSLAFPGYPIVSWQEIIILHGDFDLNGAVDMIDLRFFLSHWPDSPCNDSAGDQTDWCYGTDLNLSGSVDGFDYNILAGNWLKGYVPPEPPLPDPNMIAHWKLDESTGLTAYDSTEYHNDGTLINEPNWLPTGGQIDGAIQLNEPNHQYIDLGSNPYLEPNLPVTISAWIKLDQIDLNQTIIGLGNHDTNDYGIWLNVNEPNTITCAYGDGGTPSENSKQQKTGTTPISAHTWYHVAAVIRGPADMDLYLNGQNDNGTYYGSGGPIEYSTNSCIGSKAGSEEFFHGLIDDTRIYNRALTQTEIEELANLPN